MPLLTTNYAYIKHGTALLYATRLKLKPGVDGATMAE